MTALVVVLVIGCEGDPGQLVAGAAAPLSTTLKPTADNTLRQASPSGNDGTAATIVVSPVTGKQQVTVLRFDQAAIQSTVGARSLYSAKLELTLPVFNTAGQLNFHYGWNGGQIGAYRMKRSWTERSSSKGATWRCAADTNIANTTDECPDADRWGMNPGDAHGLPFEEQPTGKVRIYSDGVTAVLNIDVTADVRKFLSGTPNHGWMLRTVPDGIVGTPVEMSSRQGVAPAKLTLQYGDDLCPSNPAKVAPEQCGCDAADVDTDEDGVSDCREPSLMPTADSSLSKLAPHLNDGIGIMLGAATQKVESSSGLEQSLLRFDTAQIKAAIAGRPLQQATLDLTVYWRPNGWNGGRIDLHPMNVAWDEGIGVDVQGPGSTWTCASDTDTSNQSQNCLATNRWNLESDPKPYASAPTSTAALHDADTSIRFDVTADIKKFIDGVMPNHGWIMIGRDEAGNPGWVYFASKETTTPPRLNLKLEGDGGGGPDLPCPNCAKNPFCVVGQTTPCIPITCSSALLHPCVTFTDEASQNQCGFECKSCEPQCTGKTCGDDGCGGSCGTPDTGEWCTPDGTRTPFKPPGNGTFGTLPLPTGGVPKDPASAVGTMPGQFRVTDFGQASYVMPIQVPAGRQGIAPSLALSYSSSSGNGYLGHGWSLDGFSVISRCGSTYAQDGKTRPVHNDKNDQFCLDGNRLVSARAGQTYGADGTEYRTELDTFSQIIAHGTTTMQPDWWEVRAKDGRIYHYRLRIGGNKPQSPLLNPVNFKDNYDPSMTRADTWALSDVLDRFGNAMRIDYFAPQVDYESGDVAVAVVGGELVGAEALVRLGGRVREYYPWRIEYTSNDGAGLKPDRVVEFRYHARRDALRPFNRGIRMERTLLLDKIIASVGGVTSFEYRLSYTEPTYPAAEPTVAEIHNPSQLESVTQCARQSVLASDGELSCLPATVFEYDGVTPGFDAAVEGSHIPAFDAFVGKPLVLDMDGNGVDDLLISRRTSPSTNDAGWALSLNGAPPMSMSVNRLVVRESGGDRLAAAIVTDFNGDGRDDVVEVHPTANNGMGRPAGTLRILSLDWNLTPKTRFIAELGGSVTLNDANGDGLPDAIVCQGGREFLRLNDNGTLGAPAALNTATCRNRSMSIDIDGDGVREFFDGAGQNISWGRDLMGADYEVGSAPGVITASQRIVTFGVAAILDVTGDGLEDMVSFIVKDGAPWSAINESTGVGAIEWTPSVINRSPSSFTPEDYAAGARARAVPYDYNRDGRMDLLVPWSQSSSNWDVLISLGNTFSLQGLSDLKTSASPVVYDENADGIPDLAFLSSIDGKSKVIRGRGVRTPRLTSITNGLGARTAIEYEELPKPNVEGPIPLYVPEPNTSYLCAYPISCRTPKWTVVRKHSEWDQLYQPDLDPVPTRSWVYGYASAAADLQGRGSLGFALRGIVDEQAEARAKALDEENGRARTGIRYANTQMDETKHIYPFVGMPKTITSVATTRAGYSQVSTTDLTVSSYHTVPDDAGIGSVARRVDSRLVTVTEQGELASAEPLTSVTTSFEYDSFGNLKNESTDWNDGLGVVATSITYQHELDPNFVSEWLIQAPAEVTTTAGDEVHTTTYAYDDVTGVPASSVLDPLDPLNNLTTVYTVDDVGNMTHLETHGVAIVGSPVTRSRSIDYDSERIHPGLLTRENGQQITLFVDPALGVPMVTQSPVKPGATQVVREYSVPDGFGRPRLLVDAAGVATNVVYSAGPAGGLTTTATRPGTPTETTEYDVLGRVTKTSAPAFDGRVLFSEVLYNDLGLIDRQSRLHRDGIADDKIWSIVEYDPLGRVTGQVNPDGTRTDIAYLNNVACERNPRGFFSCMQFDGRGALRRVFDDAVKSPASSGLSLAADYAKDNPVMATYPARAGAGTRYNYNPAGRVLNTIDPLGNSVDRVYNTLGQLESITDPDQGTWGYTYSQFREVQTETDPGGNTSTFFYDALGRLETRTNTVSGVPAIINTTFRYDDIFYGRLSWASGPDGRIDLDYDAFGRPTLFKKTINRPSGSSPSTLSYTLAYDTANRLSRKTFKTVDQVDVPVIYEYTDGYLSALKSAPRATPYWRLVATDDFGNLEEEQFQNGVSIKRTYWPHTDLVASLRGPNVQGWSYEYDANGNLSKRTSELGTPEVTSYVYDGMDRLSSATSMASGRQSYKEAYTYDTVGNITSRSVTNGTAAAVVRSFYYEDGTGRPHAVKWVAPGPPQDPPNTTGAERHEYDASGRLVKRSSGTRDPLNITYNFLGLAVSMESPARSTDDVTFGYGPDGQRMRKTGPAGETLYLDDQYYRTSTTDNVVTDHFSVQVGGRAVAQLVRPQGGTITTFLVHTDRLGSLDTVENGTSVVERRNFEAFGKRRNASPSGATGIIRDFAGNELDPEFGLINMQARSYDPELGRFVAPDPLWTGSSPQWFNSYSYAANNPLRFTDRTGTTPDEGPPQPQPQPGPPPSQPDCTSGNGCGWVGQGDGRPTPPSGCYYPNTTTLAYVCPMGGGSSGGGSTASPPPRNRLPAIAADTQSVMSAMPSVPANVQGQQLPGQAPPSVAGVPANHGGRDTITDLSDAVARRVRPAEPILNGGVLVIGVLTPGGFLAEEGATVFFGAAAAGKAIGAGARVAPEAAAALGRRSVGAAESALSVAQRGGLHSGFLRNIRNYTPRQLEKVSRSLQKKIEVHESYLENPLSHVPNFNSLPTHRQDWLMKHWATELKNFTEQQSIVQALLP